MNGYLRNAQREIAKMKREREDKELVTLDVVLDFGERGGRGNITIPVRCTRAQARRVIEDNKNRGWKSHYDVN